MRILESHGSISNTNESPNSLVRFIIDFMYDSEYGFENYNVATDEHGVKVIDKNVIQPYYEQRTFKFTDYPLPSWLSNIHIIIEDTNDLYSAKYVADNTKFIESENKVDITINLTDYIGKPKNEMKSHLLHEFVHGYQDWLEHTKKFKNKKIPFYRLSAETASKNNIIKGYGSDYIILKKGINKVDTFMSIFYYIDKHEISAYIEQFKEEMSDLIDDNRNAIRKYKKLISSYGSKNNISKKDMFAIYNELPITCYDVDIFRRYKAYDMFLESAQQFDEDTCEEIYTLLPQQAKDALQSKIKQKGMDYSYAMRKFVLRLATIQKQTIDKVLVNMQKIYSQLLSDCDADDVEIEDIETFEITDEIADMLKL